MKYTISPYSETSAKGTTDPVIINDAREYLDSRFGNWAFTEGGRYAIRAALSRLGLKKDDVVSILTTSGNFYISSCVTNTIEEFCKWSREISAETKVIFVNHEFGYPYENVQELRKYGLPIIEDCAYDFFSDSLDGKIGKSGDFAIYSLPKAFECDFGGILVANDPGINISGQVCKEKEAHLLSMIAKGISEMDKIKAQRLDNISFLSDELQSLGIKPFFHMNEGTIPGVFMFRWRDDIDYPALKVHIQGNGVESSVFYGQPAFFIPAHHRLTKQDMLFFCRLIRDFDKNI